MKAVWIYVDTNHQAGHPDHIKVFADPGAADEWFKANDPEGVAFRHQVIETQDMRPTIGCFKPPGRSGGS